MEEIILQTLIKMRTDYSNNEMIIFAQDSDLKVVADEIKTAINYTHSCESDSELLHTEVFNLANKLAMKSKELLLKHLALNDCKGYVASDGRLYKAIINALEEAINYSHCCESDSEQLNIYGSSTRTFNELEMLAEDLECVKMWLDDKKAPKTDINGNEYSVVGRIQCLLNVC